MVRIPKKLSLFEGNRMMYQYCKENNIFHKNTGKFIVAKNKNKINLKIFIIRQLKEIPVTLVDNKLQDMYSNDADLVMFMQVLVLSMFMIYLIYSEKNKYE